MGWEETKENKKTTIFNQLPSPTSTQQVHLEIMVKEDNIGNDRGPEDHVRLLYRDVLTR